MYPTGISTPKLRLKFEPIIEACHILHRVQFPFTTNPLHKRGLDQKNHAAIEY